MKDVIRENQLFYKKDAQSPWESSPTGNLWPEEKCEGYLHKHLTWDELQAIKKQSVDLDGYKETKKDQFRTACKSEIVNLFVSDALGSNHNYDCREEDQANIVTRTKASEIDGLTKKVWAHNGIEFTREPHTTAQLQQLVVDMEAHIESAQSKLEGLINQVNAVDNSLPTAQDDIDAINW